jgi:hypothetical protein
VNHGLGKKKERTPFFTKQMIHKMNYPYKECLLNTNRELLTLCVRMRSEHDEEGDENKSKSHNDQTNSWDLSMVVSVLSIKEMFSLKNKTVIEFV